MREGVNKVALRLFEHNEKAYHAAVRMMEQYGKAAIVHPTGTGKSYIAFKLIEDNPEKVVIWLSPSEYIFKTQLESLKRNDPDFPLANVLFYTYAKLMCCTQAQLEKIAAQKPAYIILDEFHRAGAECWGESTVALLKLCPEAKLLGLTATNIRYLDITCRRLFERGFRQQRRLVCRRFPVPLRLFHPNLVYGRTADCQLRSPELRPVASRPRIGRKRKAGCSRCSLPGLLRTCLSLESERRPYFPLSARYGQRDE